VFENGLRFQDILLKKRAAYLKSKKVVPPPKPKPVRLSKKGTETDNSSISDGEKDRRK
jgi:hypothetical protein